eukprot:TRINITY_DN12542_c0_g1_i1.p1 TRINITY_DN12542_c0_g1~~TRINITY_DN12542_c0_g1_i1.p1  ORF type:complete len:648 (+),score=203.14 TRINITY_DN12542_c0_g1_i1:85-2028(+)
MASPAAATSKAAPQAPAAAPQASSQPAASSSSSGSKSRRPPAATGGGGGVAGAVKALTEDGETSAHDAEPTPEEMMKDAEQAFGELFSIQPPRDVIGGLLSGVKCVFSGFFLGLAGAIMQPIEGARESGVTGCFKGAVLGVATGLFFSITGLCTGIFQAIRGAVATPKAICMASKGWQWDAQQADWTEPRLYSLTREAEDIFGPDGKDDSEDEEVAGADTMGTSSSSRRRVADSYYYDQLRVSPSASQGDIRKAYFRQSRQWHPDKSSDPDAKKQFQAISEAYQVLSDPSRRRKYDQHGRESAGGEGFVDAKVFFKVLLGADYLAPYVGRLRLAEVFGDEIFNAPNEDEEAEGGGFSKKFRDSEKSQSRQVRRQVRLAVGLAAKLDGFVQGEPTAFREASLQEAKELLRKDAALGPSLEEIGWVYRSSGELFLARTTSSFGSYSPSAMALSLKGRGRKVGKQARTAKLAVSSFVKLRNMINEADAAAAAKKEASTAEADKKDDSSEEEDNKPAAEEEMPEAWTQALPVFMETFGCLSSHDICGTLDRVTQRVLEDTSVDYEYRVRRAEGLRVLGTAFEDVAQEAASRAAEAAAQAKAIAGMNSSAGGGAAASGSMGDEEKRRRFEEAFVASMGGGANASSASRRGES